MSGKHSAWRTCSCVLALLLSGTATHALIDVGSDGSDGAFSPVASVEIDLGLAADAAWNTPSPVAGQGVYDASMWAVVFKYSSVNIPSGVTVTFKNHPSRAPVVWLVDGGVTIDGTVRLDGSQGANGVAVMSEPGPGGFRGGHGTFGVDIASGVGFGPGGGVRFSQAGYGGSYGTLGQGAVGPTYGNGQVLPLIGGSGGAGRGNGNTGGGAGGGAILIASDSTITLGGLVSANGGNHVASEGAGSGGAIRLVADTVEGSGRLRAQGGAGWSWGGSGRVRVEATSITLTDVGAPVFTSDLPCAGEGCTPQIWPPASAPTVEILGVAGVAVPADPHARFEFPDQDVSFADPNAVTVTIEARNVPTTWNVVLRAVPTEGNYITANATLVSGDQTLSTWSASITLPGGHSALQVRAAAP